MILLFFKCCFARIGDSVLCVSFLRVAQSYNFFMKYVAESTHKSCQPADFVFYLLLQVKRDTLFLQFFHVFVSLR